MSGGELAAVLGAIGGVISAVFLGVRNLRSDKFKKDVEASAALLAGYTGMMAALQSEIARINEDRAEERQQWLQERAALKAECVAEMAAVRAEHKAEMVHAYERIDELGSQLYVLNNRPPSIRERSTDG